MLPDGWSEAKLNELGTINAHALPENTPANYEFYYLDLSAVKEGKIDFPSETTTYESAPSRARRIVKDGDILLATVRPNLQGYALAKNLPHNTIGSTGFAVITAKPKANAAFIYQALSGADVQGHIQALVVGSNYPAINGSDVKNLNILTPPLAEQKRIAEVLGSVDAAVEATKAVIDQTKTVKQGLLQTLLTRGIGHTKFKDSSLGEIPETWEVKTLAEIVSRTQLGGNYANSLENSATGYPLIKMGNLGRGRIKLDKVEFTATKEEVKNSDFLKEGDILFNTRNTLDLVGKVSMWRAELKKAIFNSNILRLKFKADLATNEYMNYFFNSARGIFELRKRAVGTTSVAAIYWRDCESITLQVPPVAEQIQIIALLESVEDEIQAEAAKLAAIQSTKKGLMSDLLTGRVRVRGND